jgi:hypothetical protein
MMSEANINDNEGQINYAKDTSTINSEYYNVPNSSINHIGDNYIKETKLQVINLIVLIFTLIIIIYVNKDSLINPTKNSTINQKKHTPKPKNTNSYDTTIKTTTMPNVAIKNDNIDKTNQTQQPKNINSYNTTKTTIIPNVAIKSDNIDKTNQTQQPKNINSCDTTIKTTIIPNIFNNSDINENDQTQQPNSITSTVTVMGEKSLD